MVKSKVPKVSKEQKARNTAAWIGFGFFRAPTTGAEQAPPAAPAAAALAPNNNDNPEVGMEEDDDVQYLETVPAHNNNDREEEMKEMEDDDDVQYLGTVPPRPKRVKPNDSDQVQGVEGPPADASLSSDRPLEVEALTDDDWGADWEEEEEEEEDQGVAGPPADAAWSLDRPLEVDGSLLYPANAYAELSHDDLADRTSPCALCNVANTTLDEEHMCVPCATQCDAAWRNTNLPEAERKKPAEYLNKHIDVLRLARKSKDIPCPSCEKRDCRVKAMIRKGKICGPSRLSDRPKQIFTFGNNCTLFCTRQNLNQLELDPDTVDDFVKLATESTAAKGKDNKSTADKRKLKPDVKPEGEWKRQQQKNRQADRHAGEQRVNEAKESGNLQAILEEIKRSPAFKTHARVQSEHGLDKEDLPTLQEQVAQAEEDAQADSENRGFWYHLKCLCATFLFATFFPMLMVSAFTDGSMNLRTGMYTLAMTGKSASVVPTCMRQAWLLRNMLARLGGNKRIRNLDDPPTMAYHLICDVRNIDGIEGIEGIKKSKSIAVSPRNKNEKKVTIDDTATVKEWMIRSREVDKCRKEIFKYNEEEFGVHCALGVSGTVDDVSGMTFAILEEIILRCVSDSYVRDLLLDVARGKHGKVAQVALKFGLVYTNVRCSISAWWFYWIVELGFGSSHSYVDFVWEKWEKLKSYVPKAMLLDFHLKILLAWACFDGSILPGHFEVELPFRKGEATDEVVENAGRDTVVGMFMKIFRDIGIKPYIICKTYGCKDLVILCVHKKADLQKLAKLLHPIAKGNGYVSEDRMKCLTAHKKGLSGPDPEPKKKEIEADIEAREDDNYAGVDIEDDK